MKKNLVVKKNCSIINEVYRNHNFKKKEVEKLIIGLRNIDI